MHSEMQSDFIKRIKQRLQQPLPGEDAQYKMAPSYRPRMTADEITQQQPRLGGVLVLLYEKDNEWFTVFTQRRKYEGVHGGQMSFPGGKKDDTDVDIFQTALREAEEEIGVPKTAVEIIGRLTELYIPPSNFLVYPVVAHLHGEKIFTPQEWEVEEIVEIPLSFFLSAKSIQQTEILLQQGVTTKVPAFVFGAYVIWGATAIMLSELREILEESGL